MHFLPEKEEVHVDDAGAEAVSGIAHTPQLQLFFEHGVQQSFGRHAVFAVEAYDLVQEPGLVFAPLGFRAVQGRFPADDHAGDTRESGTGLGKMFLCISHVRADADKGLYHKCVTSPVRIFYRVTIA